MEFRILGQLEIVDDGVPVELPPGQRRSLLIDLLLHADEAVSVDRLVEDLWEGDAPATADKIVQLHISHLRRQLGGERIERQAAGYVFRLRPGELDAQLAEQLAADASPAALAERIRLIREALALWRGRALADVEYQAFARNEAARLEELRLSLQERLFDARLQLGEHRELVPDLEALVAEHPLREHLRALLMLALYRSGRQAEALAAYRQGRVRLQDELGLDPGPELQQLERRILEHDTALVARQPSPPLRARNARVLVAAAIVAAVVAAGAAGLLLHPKAAPARAVANGAIHVDDHSGHFRRSLRLGLTPRALVLRGDVLWAANFGDRTVTRVDVPSGAGIAVGVPAAPTTVAVGGNAVWVGTSFAPVLFRLDPASAQLVGTVRLPAPADGVAVSRGAVWVVNQEAGTLVRVDPRTGRTTVVRRQLGGPTAIQARDGHLWIAASLARRLLRVDTRTLAVTTFPLMLAPQALSVGCGAVWLADPADNEVTRFDLGNHATQTIAVGQNPVSVAATERDAWVANDLSHSVQEINCADHVVTRTIAFGSNAAGAPKLSPTAVAADHRGAWVALQHF
jgi:DNA-binding SARP family transcriptional activator/DNA-binding beta-propeller fold protein YncE